MDLTQKFQRVEEIKRQMAALEAELATIFAPKSDQQKPSGKISRVDGGRVRGRKPGSKMSAEAKAKISAAAKQRWAKKKSEAAGSGKSKKGK